MDSKLLKRRVLVWCGIAVSTGALALVARQLDPDAFAVELSRLQLGWLVASAGCVIMAIAVRALRWSLFAEAKRSSWHHFLTASVLGLFVNLVYPLRAGELVRVLLVRRLGRIPLGRAAVSAFLDRIMDAAVLGMIGVAMMNTRLGLATAEQAMIGTLVLSIGLIGAMGILGKRGTPWQAMVRRWSESASPRFHQRAQGFLSEAVVVGKVLHSPTMLGAATALTLAALALDYGVVVLVMYGFGWNPDLTAPVLVLIYLAIGTALPSAPGYVGTYQVACVLALAGFGISAPAAAAYSLALQVCVLGTIAVLALTVGAVQFHRNLFAVLRDDRQLFNSVPRT